MQTSTHSSCSVLIFTSTQIFTLAGDYVFTPTTLGLSANQNRLCRVVEVPLDGVYEDNEIFYIQLSTSDDNVRIVQNETRITIEDSDGE